MSPDSPDNSAEPTVTTEVDRIACRVGTRIRDRRRQLGRTIAQVAASALVAETTVQKVEKGARGSLEMYVRIASAIEMTLDIDLVAALGDSPDLGSADAEATVSVPRIRGAISGGEADIVHALMGEQEISMLVKHGIQCGVDEPWRHYQYAGRADVLGWDLTRRALLHNENKTRFPDVQDAVGRYNGERAYLGESCWERLGMSGPPRSETHVIVALWSLEVLEVIRAYPGTFGAACPHPPDAFLAWLAGKPPTQGTTSSLVLYDPFATGSQPRFASLRQVLDGVGPRIEGYAAAAELIRTRRRTAETA